MSDTAKRAWRFRSRAERTGHSLTTSHFHSLQIPGPMRLLSLVLVLLILPAVAHAQTDNPATQEEAQIVQEVLGSTSAAPVTPQEAFDEIRDFGLSDREGGALDAFSLASQGNLAMIRQEGI